MVCDEVEVAPRETVRKWRDEARYPPFLKNPLAALEALQMCNFSITATYSKVHDVKQTEMHTLRTAAKTNVHTRFALKVFC